MAVRLVLVALPLIALASLLQRPLIEAMLPWLALCTDFFDTTYRTLAFVLRPGAELVLQRTVTLGEVTAVGGKVLMPDPLGQAVLTTAAGHVLQPMVLALVVALAWPAARVVSYGLRVAVLLPLLVAVSAVDVPIVLAALPWALHVEAWEPDRFSPLLIWKDLMQGGGRIALGLAVGIAAVLAADRWTRPRA